MPPCVERCHWHVQVGSEFSDCHQLVESIHGRMMDTDPVSGMPLRCHIAIVFGTCDGGGPVIMDIHYVPGIQAVGGFLTGLLTLA